MTASLLALYELHRGKISDKWANYLPAYEKYFEGLRESKINLFEIGVQNGGSLEIWAKYFLDAAHIIGCDIDERCGALSFDDPRINLIVGNALSDAIRDRVVQLSGPLDIVVDDGSHRSADIVKAFAMYFPYMRDGGVYVAEDLHASYWQDYEGGIFHPYSSISFFKKLCDIVNHEHWAVEANRIKILEGFRAQYDVEFDESELARIQSVTFINSICVVLKAHPLVNGLGKRVIVGVEEPIAKVVDILSKGLLKAPSENGNKWSQVNLAPEKVAAEREVDIRSLTEQLGATHVQRQAAEEALAREMRYHDGLQTVVSELRLEKRELEKRVHAAERDQVAQKAAAQAALDRVREIENTQAWRYTRTLSRLKAALTGGIPRDRSE